MRITLGVTGGVAAYKLQSWFAACSKTDLVCRS